MQYLAEAAYDPAEALETLVGCLDAPGTGLKQAHRLLVFMRHVAGGGSARAAIQRRTVPEPIARLSDLGPLVSLAKGLAGAGTAWEAAEVRTELVGLVRWALGKTSGCGLDLVDAPRAQRDRLLLMLRDRA
jgi:hypothetical protein